MDARPDEANGPHPADAPERPPLSERVYTALLESECACEKCKSFAAEMRDEVAALEQERDKLEIQLRHWAGDVAEVESLRAAIEKRPCECPSVVWPQTCWRCRALTKPEGE